MKVSQCSSKRNLLTYRHARNGTQLLVDTRIQLNVAEALDSGTAGPCPRRLPGDGGAAEADEVRTLGSRRRAGLSPKVEEHLVLAGGDCVPLTTVRRGVDGGTSLEVGGHRRSQH